MSQVRAADWSAEFPPSDIRIQCDLAMPELTLRDVTRQNWVDCIRLSLHDYQLGYVAGNAATIAESKFKPHYHLRAIYNAEQLVGMLAYCHETDPEDIELYWIFRLMIDKDHQRNGYATKAMKLAMLEIAQLGGKRIRTMHKPQNTVAAALYGQLGFHIIGALDDGDTLLEYHFDC
ncbi:MAG: GNAT family N-acetyltransferase [Planctomycetaceae bacterium]